MIRPSSSSRAAPEAPRRTSRDRRRPRSASPGGSAQRPGYGVDHAGRSASGRANTSRSAWRSPARQPPVRTTASRPSGSKTRNQGRGGASVRSRRQLTISGTISAASPIGAKTPPPQPAAASRVALKSSGSGAPADAPVNPGPTSSPWGRAASAPTSMATRATPAPAAAEVRAARSPSPSIAARSLESQTATTVLRPVPSGPLGVIPKTRPVWPPRARSSSPGIEVGEGRTRRRRSSRPDVPALRGPAESTSRSGAGASVTVPRPSVRT